MARIKRFSKISGKANVAKVVFAKKRWFAFKKSLFFPLIRVFFELKELKIKKYSLIEDLLPWFNRIFSQIRLH